MVYNGFSNLNLAQYDIDRCTVTTAAFFPVPHTATRHLAVRSLYNIIRTMITDYIKPTIIQFLDLSILDESFGLFYDLVMYSRVTHPHNHPIGGYYLYR